jgi:hypothetical protein
MSNPYRNQHAECCNASFSYYEYLPTCRYCSREICGQPACVIPGSEREKYDGRKTYICTEPDCIDQWESEQEYAQKVHADVLLINQAYEYPHKPDVFHVEILYPYRLSYIHPLTGKKDGCVRYCSTIEKLQAAERDSHRPYVSEHFEDGTWNVIKTSEVAACS